MCYLWTLEKHTHTHTHTISLLMCVCFSSVHLQHIVLTWTQTQSLCRHIQTKIAHFSFLILRIHTHQTHTKHFHTNSHAVALHVANSRTITLKHTNTPNSHPVCWGPVLHWELSPGTVWLDDLLSHRSVTGWQIDRLMTILQDMVSVCVCVCVCERERER